MTPSSVKFRSARTLFLAAVFFLAAGGVGRSMADSPQAPLLGDLLSPEGETLLTGIKPHSRPSSISKPVVSRISAKKVAASGFAHPRPLQTRAMPNNTLESAPSGQTGTIADWLGANWNASENQQKKSDTDWLNSLIPTSSAVPDAENMEKEGAKINWGFYEENGMTPILAIDSPLRRKEDLLALPNPEAIFQGLFGAENWLRSQGVSLHFDTTNEFSGAVTTPTKGYPTLKQGASNAGQYSVQNDVNWQTLAGIRGFMTHAILVGRYGTPASHMFGENLLKSQEDYGGGGNVVVHLVYAYGEETLMNGHLLVAGGRMSMMSSFAKNPLDCTFMNNAFCGNMRAASNALSRSTYPASNWAAHVLIRPTENTYIQAGVYFPEKYQYSNPSRRTGFKFSSSYINGQSYPIELGWIPEWGRDRLQGHYKIGVVPDDSRYQRGQSQYMGANAHSIRNPAVQAKTRHGNWGAWLIGDQMLMRHKTLAKRGGGLVLLGGAWWNGRKVSQLKAEYEVGLIDTGFWQKRPLDSIGIDFAFAQYSAWVSRYQKDQMRTTARAKTCDLMFSQCAPQHSQEVFEFVYRIHVMRGIYFSPDFQYFFRPGANRALKNAAMLGFNSHVQFF